MTDIHQEDINPYAEYVARAFHETYERLAPEYGYKTREESAKPWEDVPAKNKVLMIAVCNELLKYTIYAGSEVADLEKRALAKLREVFEQQLGE